MIEVSQLKQGQLFSTCADSPLYRRVYINGYIKTMMGNAGLPCVIGTNDTTLVLIAVGNKVKPFEE